MAQQACNKIAEAENEMANLSHIRSEAILHGNIDKAKDVSKQMQELRDKTTFQTYSDLLLDENEVIF